MTKYPPVHCPTCNAPATVIVYLPDKNMTKFQCLPSNPSDKVHTFWKQYPAKKENNDAETSQLEIL